MHARPLVRSVTMTKVAPKCLCTDAPNDAAAVWLGGFRKHIYVVLLVVRLVVLSEHCVAPFSNVCWFMGGGWHAVTVLWRRGRGKKKIGRTTTKVWCLTGGLRQSVLNQLDIWQRFTKLKQRCISSSYLAPTSNSPPSSLRLSCCPLTKLRFGSSPSHHSPCNPTPPPSTQVSAGLSFLQRHSASDGSAQTQIRLINNSSYCLKCSLWPEEKL